LVEPEKDDGQCPDSSSPVRVLFDEQFEAIATPSIRTVSYQSAQQLVMRAITRMHVHVGEAAMMFRQGRVHIAGSKGRINAD